MESEEEEVIGKPRRRKSFKTLRFNSTDDESVLQTDVEIISSSMSVSEKSGTKSEKPVPAPRVTGWKDGRALASERESPARDVGARTSSTQSGRVECAVVVSRGPPAHAPGSEREESVVRTSPASYALAVRATPSLPMPAQVGGKSVTLHTKDARASTDKKGETSMPVLQSTQAVVARGVSPFLTPARKADASMTLGGSCTRISPTSAASTSTGCGTLATQVLRSSTIGVNWFDIMDDDARCESSVVVGGASGALAGAAALAGALDVAASTSRASDFTSVGPMEALELLKVPREDTARLESPEGGYGEACAKAQV